MRKWQIESEEDTKRLAGALASIASSGISIGLQGGLGAGKTTLVRYLVERLGGSTTEVASPTYTLHHEYSLSGGMILDHWDLYRLNALPVELDQQPSSGTIRIIEWPERCPDLLASLDLILTMRVVAESSRDVMIEGRLAEDLFSSANL